ncbi:MAG: hypothetical protein PHC97_02410 [Patescibacteria group bacterium]|nr:hypothetical protein [Patescibacteria group bacterium]
MTDKVNVHFKTPQTRAKARVWRKEEDMKRKDLVNHQREVNGFRLCKVQITSGPDHNNLYSAFAHRVAQSFSLKFKSGKVISAIAEIHCISNSMMHISRAEDRSIVNHDLVVLYILGDIFEGTKVALGPYSYIFYLGSYDSSSNQGEGELFFFNTPFKYHTGIWSRISLSFRR